MKKLMLAALVAGSVAMVAPSAFAADEEAPAAAEQGAKKAKKAKRPAKAKMTLEERRAKMKAAMEEKAVEIIKKYGLDDEKAKALFNELTEALKPVRRPRPAKPAEAKAE